MAKTKILVTVKTYPSISSTGDELVCTAGFDEAGNWIRIHPVPFRRLNYKKQYKKYQWIEIDLVRNTDDFRPETFKPQYIDAEDVIIFLDHLDTKNNWKERKGIVLRSVYYDMNKLITDAKTEGKYTSLAVFKPTSIIDFDFIQTLRDWNAKQKAALQQHRLFENEANFEIVKKLPFKFRYIFTDINGEESRLMNEDWELGVLFWKCLEKNGGDETAACNDVKRKYLDEFVKTKDLYLFLGTTKIHHLRAKNPFIIIGTFYPKKESQLELNL